MCSACGGGCRDIIKQDDPAEIECPYCDGAECDKCDSTGVFLLSQCPRVFVDAGMTEFVNLATLAIKGSYPVAGGTLDQSAWFLQAMQTLESDMNRIDNERHRRQNER